MRDKVGIKAFYNERYANHNYAGNKVMTDELQWYWCFWNRYRGFRKDDVVLEIGCGDGEIQHTVSSRVKECHGMDISEVAIDMARANNADKTNVILTVGDNIEMYPDNTFDLIWEMTVFQHMLKPYVREYIEQSFRKLKPGGHVMFQILYDSNYEQRDEEGQENQSSWTQEEFREALETSGFTIRLFSIDDLSYLFGIETLHSYYVVAEKA